MLDERDSLFGELRHQHFAAAAMRISSLMDEFRAQNKARRGAGGWGGRWVRRPLCLGMGGCAMWQQGGA